ncbi:MAG: J domain-containing protein [Pseudomonadota bacterium]
MTERAFPLQWPMDRPRTPHAKRTASRFDVPPSKAQREMLDEIRLMGGSNVVISTDQRVKRDGTLYARDIDRTPEDPGVAIYFERKGRRVCFCCDLHHRIWENMRSIGLTIRAMRAIERYGSQEALDRAFTGFTALPAPQEDTPAPWWEVLGISRHATQDDINRAWRSKVKGASESDLYELNRAREEGFK